MNQNESPFLQTSSNKGEIVLYQPNDDIRLEVRLDKETVWLTQQQIADLFGVKQPAISKHIANIYKSGELEESGTYSILEYMGNDGKQSYTTKVYNLDMILSVGYRVNSIYATRFRQWANSILKKYLLEGHVVNQQLLAIQRQIDSRFELQDNRMILIENELQKHQEKIDFFVRTNLPPVEQVLEMHIMLQHASRQLKHICGQNRLTTAGRSLTIPCIIVATHSKTWDENFQPLP